MKANRRFLFFLSLTVLFLFTITLKPFAETLSLRRYAIISGSNDGGADRVTLRYAAKDAQTFDSVMRELGGIREKDRILLLDPTVKEFESALKHMQQMLTSKNENQERRELIFYYSGHSDEVGLLLGGEKYSYKMLRQSITEIPADVRIAIVDSCSSGALTRSKGGVRRPAFLLDEASAMRGYAFLTSSSADEAAQESDRITSSFFTHYLVSGLRGAADATGDGYITLNEAYHYAFKETLASTESTQYGPQHPAYDIALTGTGDLVLTDLRETSAGLIIPEDMGGRFFIRNSSGILVVELNKVAGQKIELGIKPGRYSILLDQEGYLYSGNVRVRPSRYNTIVSSALTAVPSEKTVARGPNYAAIPAEEPLPLAPFHFSFLPEIPPDGLWSADRAHTMSLNLLWGNVGAIYGAELGALTNVVSRDVRGAQYAGMANIVGGDVWGFQGAGAANFVRGDLRLAQTAGAVNFSGGKVRGAQAAGAFNMSVYGLVGAQLAGAINISAGDTAGAQVSGVFNYTHGPVWGAQISGLGNYGQTVSGAQISLVNISSEINGAQVGLVNIAGVVRGTQVGLINLSREMYGIPVGLLSLSRDGEQHLDIWRDGSGFYQAGFRFGTRYAYTLFSFGFAPGTDPALWSYGLGVGGHIPLDPFFINLDISVRSIHNDFENWLITRPENILPEFRATAGFRIGPQFAILAGAVVQGYFPGGYSDKPEKGSSQPLHLKPSYFLGMQF